MSDPTQPTDPPQDLTGRTVGDFRLRRKLGQGGMGQVYLARQLSLNRDVAVKILRHDHADNPTALKRFQAEAEAVARISHPNIVQVYAVGECDGLRYMALEYVNGRNLRDFLELKGPLDLPLTISVLRQIAAALVRAGELGLVHRDIKPENVLLNRKGEVKVADFGLSRYFASDAKPLSLTQSGMTLGTPLYMSPEQVQGKPVDHRSDLYSLGVTAYHLLAGRPPFSGATPFEVAVHHVQTEPKPLAQIRPDLPAELVELVHRLMAKSPDARPASAKDVLRELARIDNSQPMPIIALSQSVPTASVVTPQATPARVVGPNPWQRSIVGGLLVVAALAGGWWCHDRLNPVDDPEPAHAAGLPDIRPPVPLVSARETALRDAFRASPPHDRKHLEAGMNLGLLLVADRRLDDAEKVFADLDPLAGRPTKPSDQVLPVSAAVLARFGHAIVLAHRDQPAESIRAFEQALGLMPNRANMRKAVELLCFEYPQFGQAIADAVNRNADNQPKEAKLPASVEWLRNPNSLLSGPK